MKKFLLLILILILVIGCEYQTIEATPRESVSQPTSKQTQVKSQVQTAPPKLPTQTAPPKQEIKFECYQDTHCAYNKICKNNQCKEIECTGCRIISNHQCVRLGCCSNSDCDDNDPNTLDQCIAPRTIDAHCIISIIETIPPCIPNWQCTEWSLCRSSGTQTRTCSDLNNCETEKDKLEESQSCQYRSVDNPEPIVYAINKNFADKTPDWKDRADRMIEHVNSVFLKTTDKAYTISKYMIYEDLDYESTWNDPDFHIKWGDIGTTTIIHLVHKDGISIEELKIITPSNVVNVGMDVNIDGVNYHNILIAEHESFNMLMNKGEVPNYESILGLTLHELGHTNGLGVPDWYLYSYSDCTYTDPLLPKYNIRKVYPQDPMTTSGSDEHQFSELNSKIINMNLDHQYGFGDISKWFTETTKVYVTDADNNPIENAEVKIFCVRKNCFYCSTSCNGDSGVVDSDVPEQILYTDSSGYVEYERPSGKWDFNENENTECLAKAIKVYHNRKSKAKYVNFLNLQEDYILHNKQVHIDHIVLD